MKTNQINPLKTLFKGILLFSFILLFGTSCKKDQAVNPGSAIPSDQRTSVAGTSATSLENLLAYKASSHELSVGFYRIWRDREMSNNPNDPIMTDLPDSLDIAILFGGKPDNTSAFWKKVKDVYVPYLHSRGTKVIITGDLTIPSGVPHTTAGYATTAKLIMDSVVNKYGLDGYDIDIESEPSGTTLTDMTGVYTALSAYMGPKSGTSKLLTFDTNKTGSNSLFQKVYTMVSYVWLQAYGRGASTLQSTWNTFSPYIQSNQFVPGFSFYEENGYAAGNYWNDVFYPRNGTGRAYDYARWEPTTGKKGGVFSYAIDRDANLTTQYDNTIIHPDFKVTNDLARIMNPAAAGGGVVFYQHTAFGGVATSAIPKGNYTLSQLQAYGFVNDWASSVKIPTGWTITMYANDFSGTSWVLNSSNSNFLALSPSANDLVSSVKIQ